VVVAGLLLAGWDRRRHGRGRDTGSDANGAAAVDAGDVAGDAGNAVGVDGPERGQSAMSDS
jgi:hypothetical protein